ncbi:MAG: hypothetical protein HOQ05_13000 [Corynebacteriales bacterium]|nr:hypothetical protein [Mycobacteriales bacterium]
MTRGLRVFGVVLGIAVLVTGCGDDKDDSKEESKPDSTSVQVLTPEQVEKALFTEQDLGEGYQISGGPDSDTSDQVQSTKENCTNLRKSLGLPGAQPEEIDTIAFEAEGKPDIVHEVRSYATVAKAEAEMGQPEQLQNILQECGSWSETDDDGTVNYTLTEGDVSGVGDQSVSLRLVSENGGERETADHVAVRAGNNIAYVGITEGDGTADAGAFATAAYDKLVAAAR